MDEDWYFKIHTVYLPYIYNTKDNFYCFEPNSAVFGLFENFRHR